MASLTKVVSTMTIKPTVELANDSVSGQTQYPTALNPSDVAYESTSTPPGTKYAAQIETLSGSGAATHTIDLTNLVDSEGAAVDGSGLKVQEFRVQAPASNTAVITVQGGDSDPYELFGSGNSTDVVPGGCYQYRFDDELPDITTSTAVGATDIKFSGTGGETFSYEIIMG